MQRQQAAREQYQACTASGSGARHERVPLSPDVRALGWIANIAASPDLKPRSGGPAASVSPGAALSGQSSQVKF